MNETDMKYYTIFLFIGLTIAQRTRNGLTEADKEFWYRDGAEELHRAINMERNMNKARNIILFVGDGMSSPTLTAARILKGQRKNKYGEEESLVFEKFLHVAVTKTYNVNFQVPDSAATATAFLCGVKTNFYTLGVSAAAKFGNCSSILDESVRLSSIAQWALDGNKDAGLVTTSLLTDGTPAGLYAKTPHRDWECDGKIDENNKQCKDIARQLIEDAPGNKLKVILGGGRKMFRSHGIYSKRECRRDGKNLIMDWLNDKTVQGYSARYITSKRELRQSDPEYLLGIFAEHKFPVERKRNQKENSHIPHLKDMTEKAIKMLDRNKHGYFLLVEESSIDTSHHDGNALLALEQTLVLEEAVEKALEMTDPKETLIIVTADHSHVMTMNGYPRRGNPITGIAGNSESDFLPYTTLLYTNGPGFNYTTQNNTVRRWNITTDDLHAYDYKQLAAVPNPDETHGGDDVLVYATGPGSHLFHGLHEQSYIAHVMSYAAGIGPNRHMRADNLHVRTSKARDTTPSLALLLLVYAIYYFNVQ